MRRPPPASLTDLIVFAPEHFDDGLSDRLELTVELESELFEALVRVVDDETGAPLDGAVLQLDGFETCGPTPVTGWRRIGKKLEGVAGPAVFLPCVAAARDESRRRRRVSSCETTAPCLVPL